MWRRLVAVKERVKATSHAFESESHRMEWEAVHALTGTEGDWVFGRRSMLARTVTLQDVKKHSQGVVEELLLRNVSASAHIENATTPVVEWIERVNRVVRDGIVDDDDRSRGEGDDDYEGTPSTTERAEAIRYRRRQQERAAARQLREEYHLEFEDADDLVAAIEADVARGREALDRKLDDIARVFHSYELAALNSRLEATSSAASAAKDKEANAALEGLRAEVGLLSDGALTCMDTGLGGWQCVDWETGLPPELQLNNSSNNNRGRFSPFG